MQAAQYQKFSGPIQIKTLPTPTLLTTQNNVLNKNDAEVYANAILLQVKATGVCRSDWHGWKGHDSDIVEHGLPFTPGHECSGIIVQIGSNVKRLCVGQKVAVPFILSCGTCRECCRGGNWNGTTSTNNSTTGWRKMGNKPTVCENQVQPGFTVQGCFAEYVIIPRADRNVCVLPECGGVDFIEAAALGCRFTTAYRAVVQQGQWEDCLKYGLLHQYRDSSTNEVDSCVCAIFGCGGVGLSCIMIAKAIIDQMHMNQQNHDQSNIRYQIIAIDVSTQALEKAKELGATHTINASQFNDNDKQLRDKLFQITQNKGADLSIDAAGFPSTCENAVYCTRRAGRMVQVGLPIDFEKRPPIIPMGLVAGKEIEIVGAHGFAAMDMPEILDLVKNKILEPKKLVQKEVSLRKGAKALEDMDFGSPLGITMITRFTDT